MQLAVLLCTAIYWGSNLKFIFENNPELQVISHEDLRPVGYNKWTSFQQGRDGEKMASYHAIKIEVNDQLLSNLLIQIQTANTGLVLSKEKVELLLVISQMLFGNSLLLLQLCSQNKIPVPLLNVDMNHHGQTGAAIGDLSGTLLKLFGVDSQSIDAFKQHSTAANVPVQQSPLEISSPAQWVQAQKQYPGPLQTPGAIEMHRDYGMAPAYGVTQPPPSSVPYFPPTSSLIHHKGPIHMSYPQPAYLPQPTRPWSYIHGTALPHIEQHVAPQYSLWFDHNNDYPQPSIQIKPVHHKLVQYPKYPVRPLPHWVQSPHYYQQFPVPQQPLPRWVQRPKYYTEAPIPLLPIQPRPVHVTTISPLSQWVQYPKYYPKLPISLQPVKPKPQFDISVTTIKPHLVHPLPQWAHRPNYYPQFPIPETPVWSKPNYGSQISVTTLRPPVQWVQHPKYVTQPKPVSITTIRPLPQWDSRPHQFPIPPRPYWPPVHRPQYFPQSPQYYPQIPIVQQKPFIIPSQLKPIKYYNWIQHPQYYLQNPTPVPSAQPFVINQPKPIKSYSYVQRPQYYPSTPSPGPVIHPKPIKSYSWNMRPQYYPQTPVQIIQPKPIKSYDWFQHPQYYPQTPISGSVIHPKPIKSYNYVQHPQYYPQTPIPGPVIHPKPIKSYKYVQHPHYYPHIPIPGPVINPKPIKSYNWIKNPQYYPQTPISVPVIQPKPFVIPLQPKLIKSYHSVQRPYYPQQQVQPTPHVPITSLRPLPPWVNYPHYSPVQIPEQPVQYKPNYDRHTTVKPLPQWSHHPNNYYREYPIPEQPNYIPQISVTTVRPMPQLIHHPNYYPQSPVPEQLVRPKPNYIPVINVNPLPKYHEFPISEQPLQRKPNYILQTSVTTPRPWPQLIHRPNDYTEFQIPDQPVRPKPNYIPRPLPQLIDHPNYYTEFPIAEQPIRTKPNYVSVTTVKPLLPQWMNNPSFYPQTTTPEQPLQHKPNYGSVTPSPQWIHSPQYYPEQLVQAKPNYVSVTTVKPVPHWPQYFQQPLQPYYPNPWPAPKPEYQLYQPNWHQFPKLVQPNIVGVTTEKPQYTSNISSTPKYRPESSHDIPENQGMASTTYRPIPTIPYITETPQSSGLVGQPIQPGTAGIITVNKHPGTYGYGVHGAAEYTQTTQTHYDSPKYIVIQHSNFKLNPVLISENLFYYIIGSTDDLNPMKYYTPVTYPVTVAPGVTKLKTLVYYILPLQIKDVLNPGMLKIQNFLYVPRNPQWNEFRIEKGDILAPLNNQMKVEIVLQNLVKVIYHNQMIGTSQNAVWQHWVPGTTVTTQVISSGAMRDVVVTASPPTQSSEFHVVNSGNYWSGQNPAQTVPTTAIGQKNMIDLLLRKKGELSEFNASNLANDSTSDTGGTWKYKTIELADADEVTTPTEDDSSDLTQRSGPENVKEDVVEEDGEAPAMTNDAEDKTDEAPDSEETIADEEDTEASTPTVIDRIASPEATTETTSPPTDSTATTEQKSTTTGDIPS